MRALVVTPGRPETLRLIDIPKPKAGAGEALLRIMRVGVCATDRDIIFRGHGRTPEGYDYIILGHEAVGKVVEVNGGVDIGVGDIVVPTVRRPCPEMCPSCRAGEEDYCITGHYKEHGVWGLHGFASDYAVTDAKFIVKVPEELKEIAVLLEPTAVVVKAIEQVMVIQRRYKWSGKDMLVLGTGPIGLLSALILRLQGFNVSVLGRRPPESRKAKLVNMIDAEYIRKLTIERKYDVVIEATGSTEVVYRSLKLGKPNSVIVILGVYQPTKIEIDLGSLMTDLMQYNRVIAGSVCAGKRHFEQAKEYLMEARRKYPGFLEGMITKIVRPEEFRRAIEREPDDIKNVIDFTK